MEIKSLTGIRGVASLYIVLFHFFQFCYFSSPTHSGLLSNRFSLSFLAHGYLAVDIFFILSAFVITLSSGKLFSDKITLANYRIFMQKRFIRLYPSYLFTVLFGYVVIYHFSRTPNFIMSLTLLNLIFGLPYLLAHLWSLGAEWITYLLYPVFYKFSLFYRSGFWKYVLILAGLLLLYAVGSIQSKQWFPDFSLGIYQGYPCLLRCFGNYLIGMGIYQIYKSTKTGLIYSSFFSVIIVIMIFGSLCFPKFDVITVILFMLLILNIATDRSIIGKILGSKFLYFFGIISYPLYLINSIVAIKLTLLDNLLNQIIDSNVIYLGLLFALICIVLSFVFTYIVERPTISFLNKIIKKNPLFATSKS